MDINIRWTCPGKEKQFKGRKRNRKRSYNYERWNHIKETIYKMKGKDEKNSWWIIKMAMHHSVRNANVCYCSQE